MSAAAEGLLRVDLTWGEPRGGKGYDLFTMPDPNTLVVKSVIQLGEGVATYNVTYRRSM